MTKIVIIGSSYAGLGAVSVIQKTTGLANIDMTVVSPNTHAYFCVASPRLLSEPEKFDATLIPVEDAIKEITSGKGKFLQGSATNVDFLKQKVEVKTASGTSSDLKYDVLVIASGSEAKWAGYKVNVDQEDARQAVLEASEALKTAQSVAIIGGGLTGTETAGEIAYDFKNAKVTLYTGSSAPLSGSAPSLSEKATNQLKKLGVELVNNVKTKSVTHRKKGFSSLELENGDVRDFDVILESYITKPYTEFLPDSIKDDSGYVLTNGDLLIKNQHNVVALGDVVAGSSKSVIDIKFKQEGIFKKTLQNILCELDKEAGSSEFKRSEYKDTVYVPVSHTMMVPISRNGGVGMVFGWSIPNFLVWFAKARTFMIDKARSHFY